MFTSKHVALVVAGARLNLTKEDSEGESLTIVETNLVIDPWPAALLRELGEDAAAHVFLPDGRVKPTLKTVKIRPTRGRLQRLQFASALDIKAEYSLEPVLVQFLTFHRKESEKTGQVWAKGIIRCDFEYRDKTVREFFATSFGRRRFLSTVGLEGRLNFELAEDPVVKPGPQLRLKEEAPAAEETPEGDAPPPAPGDSHILDVDDTAPDAARTQLHTGRDKSKRNVH